jgi:serine/threonine protein kinase
MYTRFMEPQKIGRYEIKGELGRGGMAIVYLCYDPHVGREVAVKVLLWGLSLDAKFLNHIDKEAKFMAKLEHPAIVPIYDIGVNNGNPYFVMRYMSGGSLVDLIEERSFSPARLMHIFERIASAIDYMHEMGIVHGDLKPANILFDDSGEPFVADFGIAQIISNPDDQEDKSSLIGTPAYMSPEQIRSEKLTRQSDIYSLGIILYEIFGDAPFQGETTFEVLLKHINEPPRPIKGIPPDLQISLDRALSKDPSHRYDTAANFIAGLRGIINDKVIESFMSQRKRNASPQKQSKENSKHISITKTALEEGNLGKSLSALRSGQNLGRYEIRSPLETKGMEVQYLAYDSLFDREVMIRVMEWDTNKDQFERKILQMKQIAQLEHPAIVPIYDLGNVGNLIYMVERKMTGGSLANQLKQKQFSIHDGTRIFKRIALGLNEAHRKGIVHRNISTKNILFDDSNEAYIANFGLARVLDFTIFTTAGSVSGTPLYMSPEQARGEKVDSRSDIYSLGAVLFEMLSGEKPFQADTKFGILMKHINESPPNILEINSDLPPLIRNFLEKALAKNPELRYSSVSEMVTILNAIDDRVNNFSI